MNEPLITCPNCGTKIELTEALAAPLHAELEAVHQAELARLQKHLRCEAETLASRAEKKAREDASLERSILERELADERARRETAQRAELALRAEKSADDDPVSADYEITLFQGAIPVAALEKDIDADLLKFKN
jgi:hypothetical protein